MANSDNLGPHDGTLDGERFLDELLLEPGRAVVLTAGNFNHLTTTNPVRRPFHAVAQADLGSGPPLPLVLRYDSGATSPDAAEVWFRPTADAAATATIGIKLDGDPASRSVTIEEGGAPVTILCPTQNPSDLTTVDAQLLRDDEADACCLRTRVPTGTI